MKSLFYIVTLFLSVIVSSNAATISGTLSLPVNVVAPSGGAEFEVSTFLIQFSDSFEASRDTVTIAQGQNSTTYSFNIPEPPAFDEFRLEFECKSACDSLGVTTDGLWSETEGVTSLFGATEYDSTTDQVINILLETADVFTGTINFPAGFVATGAEFFLIRLDNSNPFSFETFTTFVSANAGDTSLPFTLGVPNAGSNGGWFLEVSCLSCDTRLSDGDQYATTMLGDPLSLQEDDAFFYQVNSDYSNIKMTLIALAPVSETDLNIVPVISLLLD